MTDPTDFPAAHSMDTEWFAVDKNGHVATFDSCDAGAVPRQFLEAYRTQNYVDRFVEALWKHPRNVSKSIIPPWLSHPIMFNGDPSRWENLPDIFQSVIVRHAEHLDDEENIVRATVPEGTFSELYYYSKRDAFKKFDSGEFTHIWVGTNIMTFFGFYSYQHGMKWENWISGPYEREAVPLTPLSVNDLPAEMRKHPLIVLSNQEFSRDRLIQPVASLPCQSHQALYVEVDEKTIRPIPPDNAEVIGPVWKAELEKKGFIVDPPAGGQNK